MVDRATSLDLELGTFMVMENFQIMWQLCLKVFLVK